jgi:pyruvate dehydrogenase E1 component
MNAPGSITTAPPRSVLSDPDRDTLHALERKVLWLATWMIHEANHVRPKRDGLKVGGHQASSASVVTLMTALYFHVLRPVDRVAVKPHASPVFHAIQYLLGRQGRDQLERFRALGGAQSYPSRTKDRDDVDFSTGSVGLGVGMTIFASLVQDYVRLHGLVPDDTPPGRMVALVGDAELDEGNIFEAMLEGWKQDVRNVWWVIDYNRQSLDRVVADHLSPCFEATFRAMGWDVVPLKYGRQLTAAFERPGGEALRNWIDQCPNSLYSALVYQGGAAWREHVRRDLGKTRGIKALLDEHDDQGLHALMTNLAGHDLDLVLSAFDQARSDRPKCFIAYTIKGHGLPLAGHKDNHAGLMTVEQMDAFREAHRVPPGAEYDPFAGLDVPEEHLRAFLARVPFNQQGGRRHDAARIEVPEAFEVPAGRRMSTQEGFGRLLNDLAGRPDALTAHVVSTSPDVTVSTGLGPWVNKRGVFGRNTEPDTFRTESVLSAQRWDVSHEGQHVELGIAENNLFLALAAMGLSGPLFGAHLLPIGTLYDPFVCRGLDSLVYACSQDARFLLVATPSGISLAPEGDAHQSMTTPLIGIGQPGLLAFEPAYVDELAVLLAWGLDYLQRDDGSSVYLRLTTRPLDQPERVLTPELRQAIIDGAYWLVPPQPGADLAIVACGAPMSEAIEAHRLILEDVPGAGLLAVTSADHLHSSWREGQRPDTSGRSPSPIERLLADLAPSASLVTVQDSHPAGLSWLGAVAGHRVVSLGVDRFGQSGDILDLYREYRLDTEAILDAVATACLKALCQDS